MGEQAANTKQPVAPKERIHGNIQSFFYTLLRVLPPTELSRFRPQSSKIYSNEPLFDYLGLPPFRIEDWLVPAAAATSRQPVQRLVADPAKTDLFPFPLLPTEAAQAQKTPQTVEEKGKREKSKRAKGAHDDAILDAMDALEEEEKPLTLHAIARKAGLTRHQYGDIEEVAIEYGYELDRGKGRPAKEEA